MADLKYYVVKTERDVLQIFFGKPPDETLENELEADEKAFRERWIPKTWTILGFFDDEELAKAKLKEEREKLSDQKSGKTGKK
jgi:hypothetical protein